MRDINILKGIPYRMRLCWLTAATKLRGLVRCRYLVSSATISLSRSARLHRVILIYLVRKRQPCGLFFLTALTASSGRDGHTRIGGISYAPHSSVQVHTLQRLTEIGKRFSRYCTIHPCRISLCLPQLHASVAKFVSSHECLAKYAHKSMTLMTFKIH
jgi:hypothetical protein